MSTAQAASRAQAIIDLLPGSTAFSKTAYATIGTGLGAFLISKGIYVPNDETLVLIAFALTIRTLYNKLSGPLSSYLEASIAVITCDGRCCWFNLLLLLFGWILLGIAREMAGLFDYRKGPSSCHDCRVGKFP